MSRSIVGLFPMLVSLAVSACTATEESLTATLTNSTSGETSAGSTSSASTSSASTSSASTSSASTSSDLGCPADPPSFFDTVLPGENCDVVGDVCIYDGDTECPQIHRCTGGSWEWQFWPEAGEACRTPGRVCEYLTPADACGEKAWTVCTAEATISIELYPRASDCPDELPEGDTRCEELAACEDAGAMACLYHVETECGVLEAQATCDDATWTVELPVCPR